MALSRFRDAKTAEEEVNLVRNAVHKSTQYKNKWAYGIFEEWQLSRSQVYLKPTIHEVQSLDTPLVKMSVLSINYWLTKFIQEVAKPSKERYPPKTLYGIIAGIRRFLAEQKPSEDVNPLNTSDKRYDKRYDFKQGTHIVFKLRSCCNGLCFYFLDL